MLIPKLDHRLLKKIEEKINNKTKPIGSLGKLEEIAKQIALIQNSLSPKIHSPKFLVFASDHGITDAKVSAYPKEVTYQMVMNFLNEGAAINVFCKQHSIGLSIIDAGVDGEFINTENLVSKKIGNGTRNFLLERAMTREETLEAIQTGRELVRKESFSGTNIIGFGEMGIGNSSSASVLTSLFLNIPLKKCIGKGTGLSPKGLTRKNFVLTSALKNRNSSKDPLDILSNFGGYEIAMIAGGILEAASRRMVILIDGSIVSSALLFALKINRKILDYCIFSHLSAEPMHSLILSKLGKFPILNLEMRLGEGTGAALAFPIIQSATLMLTEMSSFEEAKVSRKA
ncbi:MAG: nicotinate-nucleotide--dimethylbenzimidazole phosphoribosyltransferase [Leptospiraceae bacterium]|nr:nicotinate-nucleotide--dimethylbenzimidazole phosphoribosyltransferase [Leptospiraceae bacterium]